MNKGGRNKGFSLCNFFLKNIPQEEMVQAVRQVHAGGAPMSLQIARKVINHFHQAKPKPEKVDAPPESIDELLAQGYLGTVIEILEQKIGEQPRDFDLRLKLAEVYAQRCGDVHRAEKIVRQIETSPGFTPEQGQNARTKLEELRKARPHRH